MTQLVTSRAFCIKNNSSQDITPTTEPWLNTEPLPVFANKDDYRAWCKHPATDHPFFAMVEGEAPNLRLGNGNKPFKLHGLVADYDCAGLDDHEISRGLQRASTVFPPYAWNKTFSGGMRLVWLFEEPVFFYNLATFKRLIVRLKREFKLETIFSGLDDHIMMPEMYYCAGAGWSVNPRKTLVRATSLHMWLMSASREDDFDGGTEIPIELVAAEVEKKYPNRWDGPFELGARGVRFWDATGDAKSAIVRATGMQAFTGDNGFMTWERLFGRDFVQAYLENRAGAAIKEVWYDGKAYFRQLLNECWDAMSSDVAKRHLAVQFGLSTEKDGEASEVDNVLHRIETSKRVSAALPFPHVPQQIVRYNGNEYLNTANTKLWPASLEPQDWGDNFPWISSYLSSLFETEEGLTAFLAWLHVWLSGLHEGAPRKGHALFLIGPPGSGKSLLTTQILSRMVGGHAEATQYIVDKNQYNNALFEKALWTIDDAHAGIDARSHARFSSTVKSVVANSSFPYNRKYGQSGDLPFNGRLCVTLNEDPNSLSILPDADQNLNDKVFLIRTSSLAADVAETEAERYEIIERELGAFVRWILDFEIPPSIERDTRFGIKAYHDKGILEAAQESTNVHNIVDAVDIWRKRVAEVDESNEWQGTPSQLYARLRVCEETKDLISKMNAVWLGRHISQAIANGCPWIKRARRAEDKARIISIRIREPKKTNDNKQDTETK